MKLFKISKSAIAGQGVFAVQDIDKGTGLGIAFERKDTTGDPDKDIHRTELGAMVNHSESPNLLLKHDGKIYSYDTKKKVKEGDELTVDYSTFPFDGERDFAKKSHKSPAATW